MSLNDMKIPAEVKQGLFVADRNLTTSFLVAHQARIAGETELNDTVILSVSLIVNSTPLPDNLSPT